MSDQEFFAHTANDPSDWEPVSTHLWAVASRAAEYAAAFGASEEARMAGILHDLGKYGELFQERLRRREKHIDHWSAGAWLAYEKYGEAGMAAAAAVQGHHVGLQGVDEISLKNLDPEYIKSQSEHPLNLKLSSPDVDSLWERCRSDGFSLPKMEESIYDADADDYAGAMLDVRMLFSALVDADFIETEAHFNATQGQPRHCRKPGPELEPEKALDILDAHIERLVAETSQDTSEDVMTLRADLRDACVNKAQLGRGVFTLTAPTGTGKTLAMLAFALRHAVEHDLRRIVVVIPFLSIIEQTAETYSKLFQEDFGDQYVLEHHSMSHLSIEENTDSEIEAVRRARQLCENWDAPIVVTTSVQMLESLFANRPGPCRKLHRLPDSVVMFDEVQTLPQQLVVPTLATLSHLSERYKTSIVFATATQPAFNHLGPQLKKLGSLGWEPTEIVPKEIDLFSRARRTKVHWPEQDEKTPRQEIAERLTGEHQVLCVVNLRRHATDLAKALGDNGSTDGLWHLSTSMCPLHRQNTLHEVKQALDDGRPCRLISTQCIEAGVDIDFPVVYRAWGPLEAIAQAAGRCNRRGKLTQHGEVHVFFLEKEEGEHSLYPPGGYKQAAQIAASLLGKGIDIDDPKVFERYYKKLYGLTGQANINQGKAKEIVDAMDRLNFADVASSYKLIDKNSVNVVVPYIPAEHKALQEEVEETGLTSQWIRKARPHTVSVFRDKTDKAFAHNFIPVPLTRAASRRKGKECAEDWFICRDVEGAYDRELLGLQETDNATDWVV